jgi:DNA-binding NarL/FixJ family response regulator
MARGARLPSVYIVEDDEVTRRSLCERMRAHGGLTVDVAVGTCAEVRAALRQGRPDVLLVDLGLPDGNGVDVIAEAATRHPGLAIMVITVFGDERRVVRAIKAGATGYLLKDDPTHEIGAAIQLLLDGGSPISPAIARHLIRLFQPAAAEPRAAQSGHLTVREQEVLGLAAKGFSYAEIAQMLGLSANTIASYTKHIYEKLAVGSRAEAIYEASRLGLIDRG